MAAAACAVGCWLRVSGGVFGGGVTPEGLEAGDEAVDSAVGVGAALEGADAELVTRCAVPGRA